MSQSKKGHLALTPQLEAPPIHDCVIWLRFAGAKPPFPAIHWTERFLGGMPYPPPITSTISFMNVKRI